MRTFHSRAAPALVAALLVTGCAGAGTTGGSAPTPDGGRRAALARVTVENQTGQELTIAFRPAVGPGAEVVVGRVPAHETATLAPVPAAEPIILIARTSSGLLLELPARSFDDDDAWLWVIPPEASFRRSSGDDA